MREFKLVVMGSTGVGKSAITIRFVQGHFEERYDPTIEDCYTKQVDHNNEKYMVEILDTAGTEMFAAMRELYMKNGQGFILVYSIDSEMSFNELTELHDKVLQVKQTTKVPIILVGNKSDLESERTISTDKGRAMANSWKCPFVETSAKSNSNIATLFTDLIDEVMKIESETSQMAKDNQAGKGTGEGKRHKSMRCPKCILL